MIRTYTPVLVNKNGEVRYLSIVNARKSVAIKFAKNWVKERKEEIKKHPDLFDAEAIIPMLINNRTNQLVKPIN